MLFVQIETEYMSAYLKTHRLHDDSGVLFLVCLFVEAGQSSRDRVFVNLNCVCVRQGE
jgi:hypothetical protein